MEKPQFYNEEGRWLMIFDAAADLLHQKRVMPYFYEQFSFVYEGVFQSEHGGIKWNSMML